MGLSILGDSIPGDLFKARKQSEAPKDSYHFLRLLGRFASHVNEGRELTDGEQECLKKLGRDCSTYLSLKAHCCPAYTQVLSTLTDVVRRAGMPQVSSPNNINASLNILESYKPVRAASYPVISVVDVSITNKLAQKSI